MSLWQSDHDVQVELVTNLYAWNYPYYRLQTESKFLKKNYSHIIPYESYKRLATHSTDVVLMRMYTQTDGWPSQNIMPAPSNDRGVFCL